MDQDNLYVTCFSGDQDAPQDTETAEIWESLGIPKERIHFLPKRDNWWGPPSETGPCGPDTEMFVDTSPKLPAVDFVKGSSNGRYKEIWNDVFIQYFKNGQGKFEKLVQNNIDTGMGVERTLAILSGVEDNYLTGIWQPIIKVIEKTLRVSYQNQEHQKAIRIIADHFRSAVFIIADGVEPSNKEAGYVLRRLIRRAICQANGLSKDADFVKPIVELIISDDYLSVLAGVYPEVSENRQKILETILEEEARFRRSLSKGLKCICQLIDQSGDCISGEDAFFVYETFGFPVEMVIEEAQKAGKVIDLAGFKKAQTKHQKISQTASQGRFKSGLSSQSEMDVKYHTATHLLQAALRQVLGEQVVQLGSNITEDRLRFDFPHPEKLSSEQLKKVEELVNQAINSDLPVVSKTVSFEQAKKKALFLPGRAYPDKVSIYAIGNLSKEVCSGPHVVSTGNLGRFRIDREESSGSGKRRIYGILE
ncbi:MAG: alanine--tRNA ligase-related protein [Patescibacteria group bacterium]